MSEYLETAGNLLVLVIASGVAGYLFGGVPIAFVLGWLARKPDANWLSRVVQRFGQHRATLAEFDAARLRTMRGVDHRQEHCPLTGAEDDDEVAVFTRIRPDPCLALASGRTRAIVWGSVIVGIGFFVYGIETNVVAVR